MIYDVQSHVDATNDSISKTEWVNEINSYSILKIGQTTRSTHEIFNISIHSQTRSLAILSNKHPSCYHPPSVVQVSYTIEFSPLPPYSDSTLAHQTFQPFISILPISTSHAERRFASPCFSFRSWETKRALADAYKSQDVKMQTGQLCPSVDHKDWHYQNASHLSPISRLESHFLVMFWGFPSFVPSLLWSVPAQDLRRPLSDLPF